MSPLVLVMWVFSFGFCDGQYYEFFRQIFTPTTTPLPFPLCQAIDLDCQKRILRTFFFLMDSGFYGMKTVDPILLTSVGVSYPADQVFVTLRNINVTGARWTKLADRKFNLEGSRSGVKFKSDLHVTAKVIMRMPAKIYETLNADFTMDIQDVESNITYEWAGRRGVDGEDYLIIGHERIAVRNYKTPTYFLHPDNEITQIIDEAIKKKPIILEHVSNEIVSAVMQTIVENFRHFANVTPIKYFYKYY